MQRTCKKNFCYRIIDTTGPADKLEVAGNVRASQFTDRDNTAYYLDPADNVTSLNVAGGVRATKFTDITDTTKYLDPNNDVVSLSVNGAIQVNGREMVDTFGNLRMSNLDTGDFDGLGSGYMIFGKNSATSTCSTVCANHGLTCGLAFTTAGDPSFCSATTTTLYCWCS